MVIFEFPILTRKCDLLEITSSALIIVLVVLLVAFLAICIHCDNTNTNNDYDRAEPPQQLEAGNVPVELLDENRAAEQTIVAKRNPGFYLQPVKAAPEDFSGIEKDIDSILAKRKWNKAKQAAMKSPADGEEAVASVDVQEAEAAVVLPNEAPA